MASSLPPTLLISMVCCQQCCTWNNYLFPQQVPFPLSLEKGHRACSSYQGVVKLLQLVLFCTEEEQWAASHFRSAYLELCSKDILIQDFDAQYHCVTNQVQVVVCHDRSEGHVFFYIESWQEHKKFLILVFGAKAYQYQYLLV